MKNIVIEGARGTGKSTVARYARENTTNSTLVNFTGFNEQGQEGLNKVATYYSNWFSFFGKMRGGDFLFIHDRFYFSEMVYSKLYKDYDFTVTYDFLNQVVPTFFDEIQLVFLVGTEESMRRNLVREKAQLFGNVEESVEESMKQHHEYAALCYDLAGKNIPGLTIHRIQVDGKTVKEIGDEILALSS